MKKSVKVHFNDEKEVLELEFSISNFMLYNSDGMTFVHNNKVYELEKKSINLDGEVTTIDLYLKLSE